MVIKSTLDRGGFEALNAFFYEKNVFFLERRESEGKKMNFYLEAGTK